MKTILTALLVSAISISAQAVPTGGCGGCIVIAPTATTTITATSLTINDNSNALANQFNKNLQAPALPSLNQLSPSAGSAPQTNYMNTSNIDDNTHLSTQ